MLRKHLQQDWSRPYRRTSFCARRHGLPQFGLCLGETLEVLLSKTSNPTNSSAMIERAEDATDNFCEVVSNNLSASSCPIIGSTSSFEQTNASLALLGLIKMKKESGITIMSGANCEGEMANGLLKISQNVVDYIFSGESESSFPPAVRRILSGSILPSRIIQGSPCETMDDLPPPDFSDYFAQLTITLPEVNQKQCWLTYESSRGCWWNQKNRAHFAVLMALVWHSDINRHQKFLKT